ncbi:MAG: nitrogenase-associated protein [Methylococcales bacterium]|nr:nitrogenase-associated protein [Methylococcales bacterium]
MATIHFYEKPGCVNNTRQKQLLTKAGHRLVIYDLLQHRWVDEPEKLRSFFGNLPVSAWFNPSAPAIKNAEIDPASLDEQQAIALMVASPILIRRPLMEVDGRRRAGFDAAEVESWLGLSSVDPALETCVKRRDAQACES